MDVEQGFQSTYKELKQYYARQTNNGYTGFQSTYKELKLLMGAYGIPPNKGFQSTYKELKQMQVVIVLRELARVFSLPIRN